MRRSLVPKMTMAAAGNHGLHPVLSKRSSAARVGFFKLVAAGALLLFILSSMLSRRATPADLLRFNPGNGELHSNLGGLLPPRPGGDSCQSRMEHHHYRKQSKYVPSDYLIARLRQYEAMHRRCAPEAEQFTEELLSNRSGCQFVVWIAFSGLGNRLMTLVATFVYALLTNRVMLVDRGLDMSQLFCEPFSGASWFLPRSFPQSWLRNMNETSRYRFGALIDRGRCIPDVGDVQLRDGIAYSHLIYNYDVRDRRFFCEAEQELLKKQVPWLFIKADNYFVPSLFFMPSFGAELQKLFPDAETIFHHVGRYLLHPSNAVWSRATRFYDTYLAGSAKLVGLQLRTFDASQQTQERYLATLLDCLQSRGILPNVTHDREDEASAWTTGEAQEQTTTSVLVTSLHGLYYEKLRELYLSSSSSSRNKNRNRNSLVRVEMPSRESVQRTESADHNRKALADIVLLSFSDQLVTSSFSTFGYAAHGLAGIRPWLLRRAEDEEGQGSRDEGDAAAAVSSSACEAALSLDPCFHSPPLYDCDCQGGRDPSKVLPDVVRGCRDVKWGIQAAGQRRSM